MNTDTALGPRSIMNAASKLYANVGTSMVRFMQSYRSYICPLHEVINEVPEESRVLDVGCGNGLLLNLLADLGRIRHGHGFDLSEPAIDVARQVALKHPPGRTINFESRSVNQGIPRLGFEVITVIDVLHHIPDAYKEPFVADLCDAVPRGGKLIIKDMVCKPRWRAAANQLHDLVMARQWVHHADPATVEQWMAQKGMVVRRRATFDTLWYGHWLLVMQKCPGSQPQGGIGIPDREKQ
ncbi:MAG: class I SAM-dependent methyltransferase [Hydrogenophaga sp.]|jgi:2-polyprenyl-3-methyl-5-hydroxy-6-metoxy-1,4-benzoquinol methylase|uniref:class I SAM-dependent methyltransferase n=1 Tax=Hydrogenophaga sp. TaxID=1904254 RepID=UPI00261E17EE|nr:class I SAM-dependent methyltransferase [Hydrogenophaga sp.]MCV0440845.1 class I SAM-dependent methyltransferase [Hydrogenophaga sp.]